MNKSKINTLRIVVVCLAFVTFLVVFADIVNADKLENSPTDEVAQVPEGTFQIQIGANENNYRIMNAIPEAPGTPLFCNDIEIIFILDRSATMDTQDAVLPDGTTVSRLDAVKFATKSFMDLLPAGTGSRVGIVSYTNYGLARVEMGLTKDFTAAKNTVDTLTTYNMTAIGDGIEKAIGELQINGSKNKRIFILLTDGIANEYPPVWSSPPGWIPPDGSWTTAELYALYEGHVALTFDSTNPTKTYTLGVGYKNSIKETFLKVLASSSGGKYFFAGTTSIQDMFYEIAANLCSGDIEVLILGNIQRMKDIGYDSASVDALKSKLQNLAFNNPNGRGIFVDMDSIDPIKTAYSNWNGNEGDITKNNNLVQAIDSYIEDLKKNNFPKLKYLILVGSHEVLPMKARPYDYKISNTEKSWANSLPQKSGYLYDIYNAGTTDGYYLTDTIYADLSYNDTSADHELTPELAVGRLVETPDQIMKVIDAYMNNKGLIPRNNYVSMASWDYLDGGTRAKDDMVGSGVPTDSSLIQNAYASSSVPPVLNAKHDIVYFAGHGNYNWITTSLNNDGFMAGNSVSNGDTSELNPIDGAVIITSGCHNGVNFGNKKYHEPDTGTTYSDFPEEFAKKGVVAYIGATGFTVITNYGASTDKSLTGYSEQLSTNVVHDLVTGKDIGSSFTAGANDYYKALDVVNGYDRRVLAIPVLYGVPTYKNLSTSNSKTGSGEPAAGYSIQKTDGGTSQHGSSQVVITITNYSVNLTSGLVVIPGAIQYVSFNEPIVPELFMEKTLPYGANISVKWNMSQSKSTIVTNDIPIAGIADNEAAIEGKFSYNGFYPVTPYTNYSVLTLGGGGSRVGIAVKPVQYNSKTKKTKIWTKMVFDIQYRVPDTGISVTHLSTDKYLYLPDENFAVNISISNKGSARAVDLNMIMRDADTDEEITTTTIGSMGLADVNITSGIFSIDLKNIPKLSGETIRGELIVLDPNNDNILGSESVIFSVASSQKFIGSVSGYKINDINGNGKWDKGEVGLSGWEIKLRGIEVEKRHIKEETITNATGFYRFDKLPAGKYLIREKHLKGFVPTSSPVKAITLMQDENSINNNFTNRQIHNEMDDNKEAVSYKEMEDSEMD